MVTGERREVDGWGKCVCASVCVTATDRFQETKLGLYCYKYRGEEGRGGKRVRGRRRKRRDEGAAGSPLIPSNIPLDDRARPKER